MKPIPCPVCGAQDTAASPGCDRCGSESPHISRPHLADKMDLALIEAAQEGMLDEVKTLIEAGADVNATDVGILCTYNPLLGALRSGLGYSMMLGTSPPGLNKQQLGVVRVLLESGAKPNKEALPIAIRGRTIETVKLLMEFGADVNLPDSRRWAPIIIAAGESTTEIVLELLRAGAKINATTPGKISAIREAAKHGHLDTVVVLLAKGADVDFKEQGGWTPLFQAAWYGRADIAKALLTNGASINQTDTKGRTSQMVATERGHAAVANLIRCWPGANA